MTSDRQRHPLRERRGTVLLVAMLVLAFIAFVLGSYINLNLTTVHLANRTYCSNVAFDLAEAGAEEALWSFNQTVAGSHGAWADWQQAGDSAWKKFTDFDLSPATTGWVKVYVDNTDPASTLPQHVVALGSASPYRSEPVTRMIEITLHRRSLFAGGLVARQSVTFQGANASVDSWDSDPDHDPSTPAVPYSASVRDDQGSVASTSVLSNAAQVNEANVWGYVSTGGAQPDVGPNGSIRGAQTPPGVRIDPARVATDFNASFPPVTAPGTGSVIPAITAGMTLGTAGAATSWRCPHIRLSGNEKLVIQGDVTLVLTAPSGSPAVSLTGRAEIVIPAGAHLALYAEGDVLIAGNGLANLNADPASCLVWGTNTDPGGQDLRLAGNGALKCAVYAPNGRVTLNGNGAIMGSVVADTIVLSGNAAFHYDESLGRFGSGTPFGVSRWRELTSAQDRQKYQAHFSGW